MRTRYQRFGTIPTPIRRVSSSRKRRAGFRSRGDAPQPIQTRSPLRRRRWSAVRSLCPAFSSCDSLVNQPGRARVKGNSLPRPPRPDAEGAVQPAWCEFSVPADLVVPLPQWVGLWQRGDAMMPNLRRGGPPGQRTPFFYLPCGSLDSLAAVILNMLLECFDGGAPIAP